MSDWERYARFVEETYGSYIDWDERFFTCPECGDPIYECDWNDEIDLVSGCPICHFDW